MIHHRPENDELWLASLLARFQETLLSDGEPDVPVETGMIAEFGPRLEQLRQCLARLELLRRQQSEATSEGNRTALCDRPQVFAGQATHRTTIAECHQELGRFTLLRALGAGSHGIVYLARDPVLGRDVALKVPRPETLASPDLRRRFLREAQTVAELSHPNLVPVYDVGELGPACYVASQYCSGPTLAAWMDGQTDPVSVHLAVKQVKTLAETVDYVHRRGILHRDIKPANVLLTPSSKSGESNQPSNPNLFPFELKLTDFGLARLNDSSPRSTRTGTVLGTASYMAPEQAEGRGDRIGPATDIYALGAILYELLTGRPPFAGATDLETLRQVTESKLVSPRWLRRDLPRDLEAVCLKCLEFEPGHRYQTASSLAEDLRRFLADEPVSARRAGPVRRLTKGFQRQPVVSTLAASLTLAIVIGISVVTWLWRRSEQNYKLAEESFRDSHRVVHEIHAVLYEGGKYDDPRFQPLRKQLLETGLKYYRRLISRHAEDEAVQVDAAETLYEMGFILQTTDSKTKALETYRESLGIWESLVQRNPTEPKYQYYLAKTLNHMGLVQLETGKTEETIASWQRSHDVLIALCERHPENCGYQRELGYGYHAIADYNHMTQCWESMRENSEAARNIFVKLSQQDSNDGELARMLSASYANLAYCHTQTGDRPKALEFLELSRNICEDLVRRNLDMPSSAHALAKTLLALGRVAQSMNKMDLAWQSFSRSEEILNELHLNHSVTTTSIRDLATSHWQLAHLLRQETDKAERRQHLQRSVVLRRQLFEENPDVIGNRIDLGRSLIDMAEILRDGGDENKALVLICEAEDVLSKCPPDRRLWMDEIEKFKRKRKQ